MERGLNKRISVVGSPRYAGPKHEKNALAAHLPVALLALSLNETR